MEILAQAHGMADDGLTETRCANQALRGQTFPLPDGLAELSTEHKLRHGTAVSFAVSGEPPPLPADAHVAITRTAAEALVNAAKHTLSQAVEISLDYPCASTALAVRNHLGDNAAGRRRFATADGGYGLAGCASGSCCWRGPLTAGPGSSE